MNRLKYVFVLMNNFSNIGSNYKYLNLPIRFYLSYFEWSLFLSPRKRGNMFSSALVCVCECVSVCLSATTITKKIVDGFTQTFMRSFLGGKERPSSCFVTTGWGMWKYRSQNSVNRRLFTK